MFYDVKLDENVENASGRTKNAMRKLAKRPLALPPELPTRSHVPPRTPPNGGSFKLQDGGGGGGGDNAVVRASNA